MCCLDRFRISLNRETDPGFGLARFLYANRQPLRLENTIVSPRKLDPKGERKKNSPELLLVIFFELPRSMNLRRLARECRDDVFQDFDESGRRVGHRIFQTGPLKYTELT